MENSQNNYRVNPIIIIVVLLQIIFIIFAGTTIYNLLNQNTEVPKMRISNYSALPEGEIIGGNTATNTANINFTLSDESKRTIESVIYEAASLNNKGIMPNGGAKIRDGSAHYAYIQGLNSYFLNFLVDIEELGQSYHFVWSFGNNSSKQGTPPDVAMLMAFCPKADELIYGDFDCKDAYDGQGLDIAVYNILRHKLFSDFTVGLSDIYAYEPLTISINVNANNDSARSAAIEEVSGYLAALGFDLNDFKYATKFIEIAN